MNVNTRALDAALNVLGLTMGLPINTLVFNMVNALEAAANAGRVEGYTEGREYGKACAEAEANHDNEMLYINGYAQGAADMQAEDAAEIESLQREVQQVANEQYDDGYLDAAHDFDLSPEGARAQAEAIEEKRLALTNRAPVEDIEVCDCDTCRAAVIDSLIFPVDAEDLA